MTDSHSETLHPDNYIHLKVDKVGPTDWLTLNRPDALNALNKRLSYELLDYFGRLYRDHTVRFVIFRGAGRAFCAGVDLKEHSGANREKGMRGSTSAGMFSQRGYSEIVMRMRRCPQPIITLIQGPACGAGFAMTLASDIRIAGPNARMNAAFIRIGLSACDMGTSYLLPRLIGASAANEYLMTGRFIDAKRALAMGLVSQIVDDNQLTDTAQGFIDDLLGTAPLALRLTKECVNMSLDAGSLEAAIAMEDRNQVLTVRSNDHAEGVSAFLEKRAPIYTDS